MILGGPIFGPSQAEHPYGVEFWRAELFCGEPCPVSGSIGNRAVNPGDEVETEVGGRPAAQLVFERQPPLGLTNATGEMTPYREIWTRVRLDDQFLFFAAFYRDGDTAAEAATLAAYDMILSSLQID